MALTDRENYLRTARFEGPEWIPSSIHVSAGSWYEFGEEMEEVVLRHPETWPGYKKGDGPRTAEKPRSDEHERYQDSWGCTWERALDGLEGIVIDPPLADWSAMDGFSAPDPETHGARGPHDWKGALEGIRRAKSEGRLATGGLEHGHLVMRLYYLRGFENFMMDLATGEPKLRELVAIVEGFSAEFVRRYVEAGVDVMSFPEDLGTQTASMISPGMFAEWVTPSYTRLMKPCRDAGVLVEMHSDGYIMEIMDELPGAGVDMINPQDLVNGIDALAAEVKGRACIRLDIDRQKILPFGEPADVRALVEEEVRKLGAPEGGLMMIAGIYPPTPPRNVDALASALEEFKTYWSDGRG